MYNGSTPKKQAGVKLNAKFLHQSLFSQIRSQYPMDNDLVKYVDKKINLSYPSHMQSTWTRITSHTKQCQKVHPKNLPISPQRKAKKDEREERKALSNPPPSPKNPHSPKENLYLPYENNPLNSSVLPMDGSLFPSSPPRVIKVQPQKKTGLCHRNQAFPKPHHRTPQRGKSSPYSQPKRRCQEKKKETSEPELALFLSGGDTTQTGRDGTDLSDA